nr:MAG TPA: hypothetical protein [Caudoviricetes sp.]
MDCLSCPALPLEPLPVAQANLYTNGRRSQLVRSFSPRLHSRERNHPGAFLHQEIFHGKTTLLFSFLFGLCG